MNVSAVRNPKSRRGFTLVELVVVVLIMGIIAAVALPKMTASTSTAKNNSTKQSLAIVRDAIELYKADNGAYPTFTDSATFQTAMKPYLKGPFPTCQVGNLNADVIAGVNPAISGTTGWAYDAASGDFYVNHATGVAW